MMNASRYSKIRVYNGLGYDTETIICYSVQEERAEIHCLRKAGYRPWAKGRAPIRVYEIQ